ncbi:alcohol dehydrogenase [Calothrix sp. NIES-4071]|nr:alcohol dehydrogenase [Calothrix sp. NIES-4071]BAZ60045.1 alcohol dehydrogenase [Calothrix sp. NIES-4105]
MKKALNRQFILANRPVSEIKASNFEYREEPINQAP